MHPGPGQRQAADQQIRLTCQVRKGGFQGRQPMLLVLLARGGCADAGRAVPGEVVLDPGDQNLPATLEDTPNALE